MSKRSSTKPDKVYRFVHREDEYIKTTLQGISYEHPDGWIFIDPDGLIRINASCKNGYAWDGCSPKGILWDLVLGTPDGKLDYLTEKPITYYASLVHDFFYQFKQEVPLSRKTVDRLFRDILRDSGFAWWWVYYIAVRAFGRFYGSWSIAEKEEQDFRLIECSWIKYAYEESKKLKIKTLETHPIVIKGKEYEEQEEKDRSGKVGV